MAKYAYRCSRCRARNMFNRKIEHYKLERKCKVCNYNKFYWDKDRNKRPAKQRAEVCRCETVYNFGSGAHRRGSKLCIHHPQFEINIRIWQGMSEEEAIIDAAMNGKHGIVQEEPAF